MGLTLKDLEEVVAPLTTIGKGEITFEVGSNNISLRTLDPEEELETQRYARSVLAENDAVDQVTALEFVDKFMIRTLAYSIIGFNTTDFRGLSTIETGEKLPNGTPIKVLKHDALVGIITRWSRMMRVAVFRKFEELVERVEREVDGIIKFEEVDYDTDISRLEERLADLKERKAKHDILHQDLRGEIKQKMALAAGLKNPVTAQAPAVPQPPVPEEPAFVPPIEDTTRSVTLEPEDDEAPSNEFVRSQEIPQERDPVLTPAPATTGRQPMFPGHPRTAPQAPQQPPQPTQEDPLADVMSSFGDVTDAATIAAENQRILEMRARRLRPTPPHVSAREAFQEVQEGQDPQQPRVTTGTPAGVPTEVLRMPIQDLSNRGSQPIRPPAQGTIPKFRPPSDR